MSTYCMTTPASIDNSDSILLFSTSSAHNQPSRAPLSRENRRIRSDRKTYPSPPPSPLRPRRTSWDSGLAAPPSLKVSLKRGCSYLSEDLELGGNKPHLSSAFGHDMIPDSQLENRKAFSGTHRQSAARNNGHEQVRNVGSNTANGNAATGASSGYSSTGEIVAKLGTQTTYTPKKKRYFEVDPFTGEERITEIMDGLASAKGESGKRVYALSSFGPFGRSHSTNGSHPVSGSASPLKMKTPSGVHEGIPLLPPTLRIRTDLDTPEPVVDRKENICESPEPMESTGLSLASMANGAGLHRANTLAGSPPSQVLLAASGVGRAPDSSTSMSCIVETPVTPTATSLSAPAVGGGRSDPGGLLALHPGPEPARINDSSPVKPVNSKPLSGQCPLKGVTKDAQMPANKNRREPPPPLSLADNAGNFATLASSRERRQQPANTAHTEPILNTPGKTLTTRSVPATPVRTHSRKNSHPSHTLHSSLPEMRPLSPISPPSDEYLPHVPPDASERIIQAHADLYAMGNCGVPPPFGLPRRRIKGAYRLPMETDTPDLEDFIVLKYSGATYWQGNVGAEGTQTQPGEEGGASSTGVERWSGGNVKGPKYKARPKQKHKPGPLLGSSTIPHNSTKAKLNKKLTLKAKNNTLNQPSTGKGKSAGTSTAVGNIDYGVKSRPARKLSSLIMDDDTLGDDPMDEDYGTNSGPRPANRGGIPPSVSGQLSNGRPQRIQTKYRLSAKGMSPIDLPVATASSPYPFISDTEISSDEDIISATSAFGHGTAPTQTSLVSQSREQRKHDRINTIRFTEGGPGGEGFRQGSSSIFSTVQLGIPGVGVMGPPAAKVSPAEYKLYIGRRGDQVPLFGSGGNMVVPGLGAGSLSEHTAVGSDPQYGGSSLFQPGGIVEVRRVEDPLLEATMEIKRLIYESGHQGGLAPAPGILGGLSIEKVYWSGEREASLTKPLFGIGVDFSGRPLVKALTFSNPLTNHSYTLSFIWGFLPVNTPEKNKENAVGNSMLLSDEVKGEGASNTHSDDIRASFQVHLCVGKPGRVQKEERKRTVFVQFPNAGKGGKTNRNSLFTNPALESILWERWELDGLMRGLTRLWLERTQPRRGSNDMGLPRVSKRSFTSNKAMHSDNAGAGSSIGSWLEQEVLGLGSELPNGDLSPKSQTKTKFHQNQSNKLRPVSLPPVAPSTVRVANVQLTLPMYLQAADSRFSSPTDLPPPRMPPISPKKRIPNANGYSGAGINSEAIRRGKHRKEILMRELSDVLPEAGDAIASEEDIEMEDVCWW